MSTLNDEGFLANQITHYAKPYVNRQQDYFCLYRDVNKLAQTTVFKMSIPASSEQHVRIGLLYTQFLSSYQAVDILARRGMHNEVLVIIRSMLESMFQIFCIIDNPQVMVKKIQKCEKDLLKNKSRITEQEEKNCRDPKKKKRLAQQVSEFIATRQGIGDVKVTIRDIAEAGGLVDLYDSMYKFCCYAVHSDPSYVERYLNRAAQNGIVRIDWGPAFDEIPALLMSATSLILRTLEKLAAFFGLDLDNRLEKLNFRASELFRRFENERESNQTI